MNVLPPKFDVKVLESLPASEAILESHGLGQPVAYWDSLRQARRSPVGPRWSDIDLMRVPPNLIQGTMVVDVLMDPLDFRIRFWGTGLVRAFEMDLTGERLSTVDHHGLMAAFVDQAPRLVIDAKPQFMINRVSVSEDRALELPIVRLPLSDDGEKVSGIMTVIHIRRTLGLCHSPSQPGDFSAVATTAAQLM
ncbi:MAG: hypothetical protein OXR84_06770 [Magnetovibrio sp.]|nr:hypothetical protein [Magnetovibrio sp.]